MKDKEPENVKQGPDGARMKGQPAEVSAAGGGSDPLRDNTDSVVRGREPVEVVVRGGQVENLPHAPSPGVAQPPPPSPSELGEGLRGERGGRAWLMDLAYLRCKVVAADRAAGVVGVAFAAPMVVEVLGPGWEPGVTQGAPITAEPVIGGTGGVEGGLALLAVRPEMVAAAWQAAEALGVAPTAEMLTQDGVGYALLRVRVLRMRRGGVGTDPVWWAVAPCAADGKWLEGIEAFTCDVPERWLVERSNAGAMHVLVELGLKLAGEREQKR